MNKKSNLILIRIIILIFLALLVLYWNQHSSSPKLEDAMNDISEGVVEIHFIDVGQGDATLIKAGSTAMLIDAGENHMSSTVVKYLQAQGVYKLDYVIGTHPHSDHIGGLDYVIESFEIVKVILPNVIHTTKTYEDVLDAIDDKGLRITLPLVSSEYTLGPASFTIIAPNSEEYRDTNDYSIGIRLSFHNTSLLLAGDAGETSEKEMLNNGMELSSDILKLSHHGSQYSSNRKFLDAVGPSHVVISVGKNNEYGHPHEDILKDLAERELLVYRTDEQRNIIFTTDGRTISVNTEPIKY